MRNMQQRLRELVPTAEILLDLEPEELGARMVNAMQYSNKRMFSAGEVHLLTAFAEEMMLDWAAIDVLRDRTSGRIYVVDVNKTDTGPAVDLSLRDREKLKAAISAGLMELVATSARDGISAMSEGRR